MGKRRPGLHTATLAPQRATYATHFEPFSPWIHREFIACCYLRFTGVGSFLYRCLVEEQASGPLLFRINPRVAPGALVGRLAPRLCRRASRGPICSPGGRTLRRWRGSPSQSPLEDY